MLATLARAVGCAGVLGGQMEDILAEGCPVGEAALRRIHARKTGSLTAASLRFGAELAGAPASLAKRLESYGMDLGLLFQVVDDLLNVEGSTAELGRPAGGDERRAKATAPRVLGRERAHVRRLARLRKLVAASRAFGSWAPLLEDLASWVSGRAGAVPVAAAAPARRPSRAGAAVRKSAKRAANGGGR
jgi:geranylgeranyl diphosphate synthase type II